ncbi:Gfo/Idh/MocA family oxidoreductase [bacterium]|nr:Gfo/Idh/MocA family oxidoreductase [bacterium]
MSLTLGVIGVNHPHAGGHLQALENAPEITRLLVWDEDPASAQRAAGNSAKAEVVASPDELLSDPGVPALAIMLKDSEAGAWNLRAIEAGKWVYGDKPGAQTAEQLKRIVDAAQQHGVHFCPCYSTRSQPLAREVGSVLQCGAIGDLYSFQCTWITSDVLARGPDNWLFHKEHSAGGILTWLGCHWLDLLRFLMRSEVVEVTAMCATQTPAAVDVEDVANVCLRFDNGAVGMLRAGYLLRASGGYDNSDMQFQFEGSQGALTWYPRAQPAGYRLRTRNTDFVPSGWQRDIVVDPAPQSARAGYSADFLAEFLAAVEGRGPLPASEVDAWQVLRVIEAAYRSSAEGRKVTL